MRMAKLREAFYEDLLSTGALLTEKTTYLHDETDGMPNGGKIMQGPCRATLDTRRCGPTGGARSGWGCGTQSQGNFLSYLYLLNLDLRKVWKNDHKVSWVPRKSQEKRKNVQPLSIPHGRSAKLRKIQVICQTTIIGETSTA
jgi:hypothetical protein